jgi:ribosomal protein S17
MTGFSQTTTLEHSATNDTRLEDFMKEVREWGRDEAMGKDALPKLAVAFVRAVADGVIDMTKDIDGSDGAARVYMDYVKAKTKKQVHDRTDAGLKANISKLRQIGAFAGNPKWDAVDIFNRAFTIRADHEKDDIAVKPAYAAFVDVAREQLKQDDPLTDAEIGGVVMSTTKTKEVTLEGQLAKAHKILEEIITGENKHGIKDQSSEVLQAAECLSVRMAALMTKSKVTNALAVALEAGVISKEIFDERMALAA